MVQTKAVMETGEQYKANAQQHIVSVCLFIAQFRPSFSLQGGFHRTEKKENIKSTEISQNLHVHIVEETIL